MGKILESRRNETKRRFAELREKLKGTEELIASRACVYVTGSFGRGEASQQSDLDLFIVGGGDKENRHLSNLNEICLKADLIKATREMKIPDFSGDGEYLAHYTKNQLIEALGKSNDDSSNTFTARLLLLLESQCLLGKDIYSQVIGDVIAKYWIDYADHKDEFVPAFLCNDILRLWRTFCVNYEARTRSEPERDKAKRRLKNFKLRHSRLLTCYSALLYLLAIYQLKKTAHPVDAVRMTELSPTSRLEWLLEQKDFAEAHASVRELLKQYEDFLKATDYTEAELVERFLDPARREEYRQSRPSDLIFKAVQLIGQGNQLHRVLVV